MSSSKLVVPLLGALSVILVSCNASSIAQTRFDRTYGGAAEDWAHSARQTSDGGYIIVGYTASFGVGGADVYPTKTDSRGDTLWTRTYGGRFYDEGFSVQQTFDAG